jgi:dienelactone hydrolase
LRASIGARGRACVVIAVLLALAAPAATGRASGARRTASDVSTVPEIPTPAGVTDEPDYHWYTYPASTADAPHYLLAVKRSPAPSPHPALLLPDTSGGFNRDYLVFADELAARGVDVAVACLYTAPEPLDPSGTRVPCPDAPLFDGVAETFVGQLDSVVEGAYAVLGPNTPLAIMGFSRGAGVTAMRASALRFEPVILASGRYDAWGSNTAPDGRADVVQRADHWLAPALILHGTIDAAVPVAQSSRLEAALRAAGVDVESRYYEGAGHNLSGEPTVHDDLVNRVIGFLCAHYACAQ